MTWALAVAACSTEPSAPAMLLPLPSPSPTCAGLVSAPALGGSAFPAHHGGGAPIAGSSTVLAVSKLYYGDSDRSGTASECAWAAYGLNIDGKVTTATSTNVCAQAPGSARVTQADGIDGIDNSFGDSLLGALDWVSGSTFLADSAAALQQGGPTMLLRLDGLGAAPSYASLPGGMVRALGSQGPPSWDGADVRDIDERSLVAGSLTSPLLSFPAGYVTERVWVGAPASGQGMLELSVQFHGYVATPLAVTHLQVAMTVAPSNASASGVLAGVIPTASVLTWFQQIAGGISPVLCVGSAFEAIATQIEQTSDIMIDGSNEPGAACNAISIGLGFDATAVKLGSIGVAPLLPDACGDAGSD